MEGDVARIGPAMIGGAGRVERGHLVAGISAILALGACVPSLAGQGPDCDGRGILQVVVVDDSGAIPIPNATVIVQWTDADRARRPVRQEVGSAGELVLCAPRDARQATIQAEFGDASSQEAVVGIAPETASEVELRLLLASATTGRVIGGVNWLAGAPSSRLPISSAGGLCSSRK